MEWVTLTKVFNPAEADLIRSRLEAAGFTVMLKNMGAALSTEGYSMVTGGIWVQVPEASEADARALLASLRETEAEPEPDSAPAE
ncbi:MAG: DUF2007 domain-containing protein [Verrucomicrobiae bacterium]|nr:DUF2007 domain-containing protein [Verrucomicrobiae bacterium]